MIYDSLIKIYDSWIRKDYKLTTLPGFTEEDEAAAAAVEGTKLETDVAEDLNGLTTWASEKSFSWSPS